MRKKITSSIVAFFSDEVLPATLNNLFAASRHCPADLAVYLINNGPNEAFDIASLPQGNAGVAITVVGGHGNIGFGRGHNLILEEIGDYHLILNPDVDLHPDALRQALDFMENHPECGLLTPQAAWSDNSPHYLCKTYPTITDLFLRGLGLYDRPAWAARRSARYEMRDSMSRQQVVWEPPLVSGCFMFYRGDVLRRLGGFDPKYFLYFEDFDLSLRTAQVTRIAYVPTVRIVHHGGFAAKKGLRHLMMFCTSALRFFNTHGWRWI